MKFYQSISEYYDYIFPLNKMQVAFVLKNSPLTKGNNGILDIGCGTGNLAIALAVSGYNVTGIDLDPDMIKQADYKSTAIKNRINFKIADMGALTSVFNPGSFDILTCFGNTLVHLKDLDKITTFLKDCRSLLKPDGKLLLQILNYEHILDQKITQLPLIENEMISFERYYDFESNDSLIDFNTALTIKQSDKVIENSIQLYPLKKTELGIALNDAGFTSVHYSSSFDSEGFDPICLPLIVIAK